MSGRRPVTTFATVANEGGLLLPDTLVKIQHALPELGGMTPDDFGLARGQRLEEGASAAWSNALAHWRSFQVTRTQVERGQDRGTTETREWVQRLLTEIGFPRLTYRAAAEEFGGERFPISHRAGSEPGSPAVQIVSFRQDLNRPAPSIEDAAKRSPQLLMQTWLNASDQQSWGIVTNGLRLRLLRDSHQLARQSYIEFDLEAMFNEGTYSDFQLCYFLLHRSRFQDGGESPETARLEQWRSRSREEGTRARELLSIGVSKAIEALGQGFVEHPENERLRELLKSGGLSLQEYYRQLLRLVYRLLFLTVAEERDILFAPNPLQVGAGLVQARVGTSPNGLHAPRGRDLYLTHYSIERLRKLADRVALYRDDQHTDLWRSLLVTFDAMRDTDKAHAFGLEPLGGGLFDYQSCPDITDEPQRTTTSGDLYDTRPHLTNARLLEAIRGISVYAHGDLITRVNYRDLDVEELGSVYESLLDREPVLTVDGRFEYQQSGERKSTGSYYTPSSLVHELIVSALEPVLAEALAKGRTADDKRRNLLALKVCDPACGSGHFLLAAARRLGQALAELEAPEGTVPGPEANRAALREVIRRCIYGVDKNPLAVDLCKTALWIESHAPGEPLGFLDHRIRNGDSLVGVFDLTVLETGIPDEAYAAVTGDDKKIASGIRKTNREERGKAGSFQKSLFEQGEREDILTGYAARLIEIDAMPDHTIEEVKAISDAWERLRAWESHLDITMACHLWTNAFFAPMTDGSGPVPTTAIVRQVVNRGQRGIDQRLVTAALVTASALPFFHWPLEFPEVFVETKGGFDVMLGNPPWEQVQLDPREFFASRDASVSGAANMSARDRVIKKLRDEESPQVQEFDLALRQMESVQAFVHGSSRFPLTSFGRINTAPLFAELGRQFVCSGGLAGIIVPSGIATDSFTQHFFRDLVEKRSIVTLYDFENSKPIFMGVHRSYKFCLLVMTDQRQNTEGFKAAFFLSDPAELRNPDRVFSLTAEDIALINPNTRTSPIFRNRRDAEITKAIYRRAPVLVNEETGDNQWGVKFKLMFMMNTDSHLFRTREQLEGDGYVLGADGRFRKPLYVHNVDADTTEHDA